MNNFDLLKAVENRNLLKVLSIFEPLIKKSLQNTPYQDRFDLEQEIAIKIFEKMNNLQLLEVPSFFEFIDCEVE